MKVAAVSAIPRTEPTFPEQLVTARSGGNARGPAPAMTVCRRAGRRPSTRSRRSAPGRCWPVSAARQQDCHSEETQRGGRLSLHTPTTLAVRGYFEPPSELLRGHSRVTIRRPLWVFLRRSVVGHAALNTAGAARRRPALNAASVTSVIGSSEPRHRCPRPTADTSGCRQRDDPPSRRLSVHCAY